MLEYTDGVSYLRTSRPSLPVIYEKDELFDIGGCKVLRKSKVDQVCIVSAGVTLHEALEAHGILLEKNINVSVIDLYSVKPLDRETVIDVAIKSGKKILVVEDHYKQGGIGEAVASELSNTCLEIRTLFVDKIPRSGTLKKLFSYENINAESIVSCVVNMCL